MANLLKISLLLLAVAIVACNAEAPKSKLRQVRRFQQQKQRPLRFQAKRKLARQEAEEEEAVTPYPTAQELKPSIAFEEGNKPDEVYGPPDEVYGPPEAGPSPADVLPSEDAPIDFGPNPDAEEFQPSELEAEQPLRLTKRKQAAKKIAPSRLTQKKKKSKKSQRLVAATVAAPAVPVSAIPFTASFPASGQQYFVVNQPFSYSAQYHLW